MEKPGPEKRELLVKRVSKVRDAVLERFRVCLTPFRAV